MSLSYLKKQAEQLKLKTLTIYFAARDPDMPMAVRYLAILVTAYALSPIDLIPDFIPVIGLLDDLIIIPLGLYLVIQFTPPHVMRAANLQAIQSAQKPVSYTAAAVVLIIWLFAMVIVAQWMISRYNF